MSDLFAAAGLSTDIARPLADRLRPQKLADLVGQDALLGPDGRLTQILRSGVLPSMILWGPPGVGKTTIARLLAAETRLAFVQLSAVFSGVADLRKTFEVAKARRATGQGTLLFVDEIHRFNRAQQDGFLPFVEEGVVTLIGATTENPAFEINAALLSRCQLVTLAALDDSALERLLQRAEEALAKPLPLTPDARAALIGFAQGDGRHLLTLAETVFAAARGVLDVDGLTRLAQRRAPNYDKDREGHYGLISALHKAVRASDPDASLYWFARMLEGGEDPLFLARRLVRMASEDIGLAEPGALTVAMAGWQAYERLGSPEGELALAQVVLHLACAPKSNAVYNAYKAARRSAAATGALPPQAHSLNAPNAVTKAMGRGDGYLYDHDYPGGFSGQNHFPAELGRPRFFQPTDRGAEARLRERLAHWAQKRDPT